MSVAHQWLDSKVWPTKPLSKDQLEHRIERVVTLTNLGYLGTVRKDLSPIVTPLEVYNEGVQLYFFPQPNSPKLHAMKRDPRVSLAMANSMAGWACVIGAQFFGTVTFLDVDTPEWEHGMNVFKWVGSAYELGARHCRWPPARTARAS